MYAYSTVKLRKLNIVAALELAGKLSVGVLLFPFLGYASVPLGTTVAHVAGVAFAYRRLSPQAAD